MITLTGTVIIHGKSSGATLDLHISSHFGIFSLTMGWAGSMEQAHLAKLSKVLGTPTGIVKTS